MENIYDLRKKKRELEEELEKLEIKETGTRPWGNGVLDSYNSTEYSYTTYINPQKAATLKYQIDELNSKINDIMIKNARKGEAQYDYGNTYKYTSGGQVKETTNIAQVARHEAQQRFFAMGKLQQTLLKVTGKYNKFEKLWNKAASNLTNEQQEEVANELNRMFR